MKYIKSYNQPEILLFSSKFALYDTYPLFMKKLILLLFVLVSQQAFSQITFHNKLSWEQAARKAKKEDKLIFIFFEKGEYRSYVDSVTKAFNQPVTKELFKKNFVSLRADIESEKGKLLQEKFRVKSHWVALFTDPKGNILHHFVGAPSDGSIYTYEAEIGLKQKGKKQLSDYTDGYRKGQNSKKFMEEFIVQRGRNLLPVNELLDEYIGQLPIDSLQNPRIINFIYQQGPTLDSRAFAVINAGASKQLRDSLFSRKSYVEMSAINSKISKNSFEKAVETKNENLAMNVAMFSQGTYGKDFMSGTKAFFRTWTNYYKEVKDTTAYLKSVGDYVSLSYMTVNPDSLLAMNEREIAKAIWAAAPQQNQSINYSMFALTAHNSHRELNEYAWDYFKMASKKEDLERALAWSEKSLEFFKVVNKNPLMSQGHYAYLDTYAQLLYKLDRKAEAIEWQTKAIEVLKATGDESAGYERTLNKMKSGTL